MKSPIRYFGGIDFSGAREPLSNLWSAVGEERKGRLRILSVRPHAYRADLAAYVMGGWRHVNGGTDGRILWGADFPFGLAAEAADELGLDGNWSDQLAWVADRPADEVRAAAGERSRLPRRTDSVGPALPPLDMRLYKQTVEGLRWLHELRETAADGVAVLPQTGSAGDAEVTLIEVYPSLAVRDLGLPRRRAPGRPGEVRARAAAFRPYLEFDNPDCEAAAVTLEDAWDATIACLTAFLCREDLDQPGRMNPLELRRVQAEGWIYRPPAALA